jgi:hypothetical protein
MTTLGSITAPGPYHIHLSPQMRQADASLEIYSDEVENVQTYRVLYRESRLFGDTELVGEMMRYNGPTKHSF